MGATVIDIASGVAVGEGDSEHAVTKINETKTMSSIRMVELVKFHTPVAD